MVTATLAIAIAILSKPEDLYEELRVFRPRESYGEPEASGGPRASRRPHFFYFSGPPDPIFEAALGLAKKQNFEIHDGVYFVLENGDHAVFQQGGSFSHADGSTCRLIVYEGHPSWFDRFWVGVKERFGW